jgi:putative ABC transport system permease protein
MNKRWHWFISFNFVGGKFSFFGDGGKTGTIVGVLADLNNTNLYTSIEPTVIFSSRNRYKQATIKLNNFDAKTTIDELRKIWENTFPNEVFEYSFYDQELAQFYEKENLIRSLCISFALLSIFISCLGLFGLATFTAQQRTKEIGIRKVLGASVTPNSPITLKRFLEIGRNFHHHRQPHCLLFHAKMATRFCIPS